MEGEYLKSEDVRMNQQMVSLAETKAHTAEKECRRTEVEPEQIEEPKTITIECKPPIRKSA